MSTNPQICPKCGEYVWPQLLHACPPDVFRDARIAELERHLRLQKEAYQLLNAAYSALAAGYLPKEK